MSEGFLVVLREPPDRVLRNARYRGLDRTPPWSQRDYEGGFEDPYVFGAYITEAGLIAGYDAASDMLRRFTELWAPEHMEIIYTHTSSSPPSPLVHLAALDFLGIDVAKKAPFYSIVGDPPVDAEVDRFLTRLNASGLFATVQEAEEYLAMCRARRLEENEADDSYRIWHVYVCRERA